MAKSFTDEESCRNAAKALRNLADRIEAQELIPINVSIDREMHQHEDYSTGTMVTVPTKFSRLTIMLRDADVEPSSALNTPAHQ
jgi:hypothetical protein